MTIHLTKASAAHPNVLFHVAAPLPKPSGLCFKANRQEVTSATSMAVFNPFFGAAAA